MERIMTLKDHVYEYIADQIRLGNLKPEEKINENEISDTLGISRTPVREALIQLAAEGVLQNNARRGFMVKAIDTEAAMEFYELLGTLEGLAAKKACPNMTEKDYKDMQFLIDTIDLAIKSGNFEMYHNQQFQFHQRFIDRCGNHALIECIGQYKKKLLKQTYIDDPEGKTRDILTETNDEHKIILQMFIDQKADELMKYLSEVHWRGTQAEFDLII